MKFGGVDFKCAINLPKKHHVIKLSGQLFHNTRIITLQ